MDKDVLLDLENVSIETDMYVTKLKYISDRLNTIYSDKDSKDSTYLLMHYDEVHTLLGMLSDYLFSIGQSSSTLNETISNELKKEEQ